MSDNYYIILGLDTDADDWSVIEGRIKECQRRWAMQKNQGAPKDRRNAEKYLRLIPDMQAKLLNPESRKEIASNAAAELKSQKSELLSKLDELICHIQGKSINADALKQLARQAGDGLLESEILTRLKANGISVESSSKQRSTSKTRSKLEPTVAQNIRDNLRHIQCANLYEFLVLGSRSSPKSLSDAAQAMLGILRKKPISSETTIGQELAGLALAVFKNAEEKERYDNTLATEAMDEMKGHLEIAGLNSFLDQNAIDKLVQEARVKGVKDPDIALEYIQDFARKRKWGIQRDGVKLLTQLKICGFCNAVARGERDIRCHQCGEELIQACPRCGHPTPTQDECCSSCGCSTGDAPLVKGLLREGKHHFSKGDLSQAQVCFERALVYWENWQPALQEKMRVETAREVREAALSAINNLVRVCKLEEALITLDRFSREYGSVGTESLSSQIKTGMNSARNAFRAAELLLANGKTEDAVEKFSETLNYCADFLPALRALATLPPPKPSGLYVSMAGSTARLRWDNVRTRGAVTYRVLRKAFGSPNSLTDGTTVGETQAASCDDTSIPSGTPLYYTVFALRGGASSASATSGPHMLLADVANVIAEAGDSQVSLHWTPPTGCSGVEVWREINPQSTSRGTRSSIPVSGTSAVDLGLKNGNSYGYLIVACFTDPADGRGTVRSPGIGVVVMPVEPPHAVEDLKVRREDRTAILHWTPPARGDVQIRQTRISPSFTKGRIVPLATADQYGAPVPVTGRGTTQTTLAYQGRVFFVPLSVIGQTVVLGSPVAMTTIDEVTSLQSQRQGDSIHLTWCWPSGATEVRIVWKYDAQPTIPEDSAGGARTVTRSEYDRSSVWTLRNAKRARHYFTIFVRDPGAEIYSTGAYVLEANGLEVQVNYRVYTQRNLLRRSLQKAWIELQTTAEVTSLPALIAVLKHGLPPTRPEDGRIIVRLSYLAFHDGKARIDLPVDDAIGFIKLFFKDGVHAQEIRLMPASQEQLKIG